VAFKVGSIYADTKIKTGGWNKGLKKMGGAAMKAGAVIGAVLVATMTKAVIEANKYQKALSNVATLVDTSKISMVGLSKQILSLNPNLGTATNLTNGLYQAFSAGAKTSKEAMEITKQSAKFGKAALTDTATAVDVITTAMNAYGHKTITAKKASDIFFTTIKLGKITGEQLSASIGNSIPLYASVGIKLKELTAGIAAMTKKGVNAAKATVQLNSIVNAFIKPTSELSEALKKQGYASGTAFLKAKGLKGALELLQNASEGSATKLAKLTPNVRALRGIMALTKDGGEEFNSILKKMGKSAGVTDTAFKKQEKTFTTLKSSYNKSLILVGNLGKVLVDQAAQGAITAANSFNKFIMSSRGMNIVSSLVGGVAAGFKLFKDILKPLIDVIFPGIKSLFGTLKDALEKVFGKTKKSAGGFSILAQTVTILASAFTIGITLIKFFIRANANVITAVLASGKTLATFYKFLVGKAKWSEVKKQASAVGTAFKDMVKEGTADIKDIIKTSVNEFKGFNKKASNLSTKMAIDVKTSYSTATQYVKDNYDTMLFGAQNLYTAQKEIVEDTRKDIEDSNDDEVTSTETKNTTVLSMNDLFRQTEQESITALHDFKTQDKLTEIQEEVEANIAKAESANKDYYVPITTDMGIYADYYKARQDAMEKDTGKSLKKMATSWKTYYNEIKGAVSYTMGALQNISDLYFTNVEEDQKDNTKKLNKELELQFNINKGFKIAQVWMNAGTAVMGWWEAATSLGPIAGPIFAGIMTGATTSLAIAQTALIAQQKFVPKKEKGGISSGFTRVNEQGGEIQYLPDNTIIIPNDISRQIAANTNRQGNVININFDGAQINSEMDLEYVADFVSRKLGERMRMA